MSATNGLLELLPSLSHLEPCKVGIDTFSSLVERTSPTSREELPWFFAVLRLLAADPILELTPLYDLDANDSRLSEILKRLTIGYVLRDYLNTLSKAAALISRWEAGCRTQKMLIRRIVGLVNDEDLIMNPYWGCAVADALPQGDGDDSLGSIILDFRFEGEPGLIRLNAGPHVADSGSATIIRAWLTTRSRQTDVVLKVAKHRSDGDLPLQLLSRELACWRRLRHERILPLFGTCSLGRHQIALVTPYMHFGTLSQYLSDRPTASRKKLNPASPHRKRSKTTMSDVYAYGMTIYEAFTGAPPWAGVEKAGIVVSVSSGRTPLRPEDIPGRESMGDGVWQVCLDCWEFEPEKRPQMGDALRAMWSA
ncbi:hypothetical protein AURDEDRAFT_130310 [Auricularia subglabra TFB-10046 SS5]|uniref:Serine-threonine/tyrosine-protein kinase catalytic domain-containing protein n=1 Tax=Auricularia subglabra (strain TFB-10046 / SS5) TaxID=717982 RepID=J0WSH7_AURST|nr:hypothetical protein AURDEDRAFT_130310 [Auricularia subglabra TFB-10046 SS5]